mmetsp:Transcript_5531/g.5707  ORF Transcript_5531/g.5707 Transcript_5531/m.5707 type:complete len:155 (+) Transcript_5531:145-609(+)
MSLTRKQAWRKTPCGVLRRKKIPYEEEININRGKARSVTFGNIKIIVVPSRIDYIQHGVSEKLWYSRLDLYQFKQSASLEIRAVITLFNIDIKAAMKVLYQKESLSLLPAGDTIEDCVSNDRRYVLSKQSNEASVASDCKCSVEFFVPSSSLSR